MTNRISTRKVSLRSVCDNDDTLAAIRFIVEYVATPLRVRLLDFLRHWMHNPRNRQVFPGHGKRG